MRKCKSSANILEAKKKEAGITSIDENLDLGNGLTASEYKAIILMTEAALDAYNAALAKAEALKSDYLTCDAKLNEYSIRMLRGIEAVYGPDSIEFGKAGGVRKSLRKHPVRKAKVA
jgi:hypothetical protein